MLDGESRRIKLEAGAIQHPILTVQMAAFESGETWVDRRYKAKKDVLPVSTRKRYAAHNYPEWRDCTITLILTICTPLLM